MAGCSRREFNLLLCGAAVELAACGSSLPTVAPAGNTVTLAYAQFPALASPGGAVVVGVKDSFPIVVVRTGDTSAVALSATCTHAGCTVGYDAPRDRIHCDCHDANFDSAGKVLGGPTSIPLPVYAATPGADAIVVNLS